MGGGTREARDKLRLVSGVIIDKIIVRTLPGDSPDGVHLRALAIGWVLEDFFFRFGEFMI